MNTDRSLSHCVQAWLVPSGSAGAVQTGRNQPFCCRHPSVLSCIGVFTPIRTGSRPVIRYRSPNNPKWMWVQRRGDVIYLSRLMTVVETDCGFLKIDLTQEALWRACFLLLCALNRQAHKNADIESRENR